MISRGMENSPLTLSPGDNLGFSHFPWSERHGEAGH